MLTKAREKPAQFWNTHFDNELQITRHIFSTGSDTNIAAHYVNRYSIGKLIGKKKHATVKLLNTITFCL